MRILTTAQILRRSGAWAGSRSHGHTVSRPCLYFTPRNVCGMVSAVWSDLGIFESSWIQILLQNFDNFLATIKSFFLGNLWKLWATFYSNIWSHRVSVWLDWGIYCSFSILFQACGNSFLTQIDYIYGNFWEGVNILFFNLANICIDIGRLFTQAFWSLCQWCVWTILCKSLSLLSSSSLSSSSSSVSPNNEEDKE